MKKSQAKKQKISDICVYPVGLSFGGKFVSIREKRVHFVGIGGIGISALAQWYLSEGWGVSGSDLARSDITEMLKRMGVKFLLQISNFKFLISNKFSISKFQRQQGEIKKCIKKADMVIYSSAVPENDFQIKYAKKLGKKVLSYPEALGELTEKYKTICVSGTHGKSTTTAMLALIMIKAGLDPTVILGTKLKEFFTPLEGYHRKMVVADNKINCEGGGQGYKYSVFLTGFTRDDKNKMSTFSHNCGKILTNQIKSIDSGIFYGNNFRKGKGEWLLIEADEYKAAFLNYSPYMIILTNIEEEHLDYYKDLKHILGTYRQYIGKLRKGGVLVVNMDDKNLRRIFNSKSEILNLKQIQNSKFKIQNYSLKAEKNVNTLREILRVPGEFNVYNALAALTAARALGVNDKISLTALSEYRGAWRRMEPVGNYKNAKIISDYAHNPAKVKAALSVFEGKKKTLVIYQPHHQQRLNKLFNDFVRVFGEAPLFQKKGRGEARLGTGSQIIITDVYEVAGREKSQIPNPKSQITAFSGIPSECGTNSKLPIFNSKILVETINKKYPEADIIYVPKNKLEAYLKNMFQVSPKDKPTGQASFSPAKIFNKNLGGQEFQAVVFMGAGDIDTLAREFLISKS